MFRLFLDTERQAAGAEACRTVSDTQTDQIGLAGIGKFWIDFNRGEDFLPGLVNFDQFRGRVDGGKEDGFPFCILFRFERGNITQCSKGTIRQEAAVMFEPNARGVFGGVVILRHLFEVFAADVSAVNGCAFGGDNVVFHFFSGLSDAIATIFAAIAVWLNHYFPIRATYGKFVLLRTRAPVHHARHDDLNKS